MRHIFTADFFRMIISHFLSTPADLRSVQAALQDFLRLLWPSSNVEYWIPKINRNVERDVENHKKLIDMGWKVLIVWECELKKNMRENRLEKLCNEIR